jgi:hypothetical protein
MHPGRGHSAMAGDEPAWTRLGLALSGWHMRMHWLCLRLWYSPLLGLALLRWDIPSRWLAPSIEGLLLAIKPRAGDSSTD